MSTEMLRIIIVVVITVPSVVLSFLLFRKHTPNMNHPFLWGTLLLLMIMGLVVGVAFIYVWAALFVAAALIPPYSMYMWFGSKKITDRWDKNLSQKDKGKG